jgi:hypothetical protein
MFWFTVEGLQSDLLLAKDERLCIKSSCVAIIKGLQSGSA